VSFPPNIDDFPPKGVDLGVMLKLNPLDEGSAGLEAPSVCCLSVTTGSSEVSSLANKPAD